MPERRVPSNGPAGGRVDASRDEAIVNLVRELAVPLKEQLAAFQELIQAGKVRYVGVSNETPYGVCTMCELAKRYPDLYPKIVSIGQEEERTARLVPFDGWRRQSSPSTMSNLSNVAPTDSTGP